MKNNLSNKSDLQARMRAIEIENEIYLSTIKNDLVDVNTYLPSSLTNEFSVNSISDAVSGNFNNKTFKLGLLLPVLLNNTLFKSKSKATKTLVTSLALVLDDKLEYKDIKKALNKLFRAKKKKKKKKKRKKKKNKLTKVVPLTEDQINVGPSIVETTIDNPID